MISDYRLNGTRWEDKFFGQPWPSGVCEEGGIQVTTPVGVRCVLCQEEVQEGDQGSFMLTAYRPGVALAYLPVHRECSLRAVMGGIGHLKDHFHWCSEMHDPDGGFTYRASAMQVWDWVQQHGIPGEA